MTYAFTPDSPYIGTETGFAGVVRLLHQVALPFFVAVVVFSTVAMANVPVARWLDGSPEQAQQPPTLELAPETAAALLPAAAAGKARARKRCAACGVVESIRRIDPVEALPATYEFTVRLRDGSMRLSSDTSRAKWRVGDRIMLIGGLDPAVQH